MTAVRLGRRRGVSVAAVMLLAGGVHSLVALRPGVRSQPAPPCRFAQRRAPVPVCTSNVPREPSGVQESLLRVAADVGLTEAKPSAAAATDIGEDAAAFSLSAQSSRSWTIFSAAVATVLTALYVFWIRADTGYSDDFVALLEGLCGGNSHLVTLCLGIIFPLAHSGLASLRSSGEKIIGARAWRVLFACVSLPLAYTWIVYFIAHRYDGIVLWSLQADPTAHAAAWALAYLSFFFLYPSTFNLLEVAAVDRPKLHMWESGVTRITRHPQMVGQVMWSAAHMLMIGTTFTALTMALLIGHHGFAVWNGDRRQPHQASTDTTDRTPTFDRRPCNRSSSTPIKDPLARR